MFGAFRGWLGHRRAPGKPRSPTEDIFRIKRPCVALVTRHQMQSLCCATHAFAHLSLQRIEIAQDSRKKQTSSCIQVCQVNFRVNQISQFTSLNRVKFSKLKWFYFHWMWLISNSTRNTRDNLNIIKCLFPFSKTGMAVSIGKIENYSFFSTTGWSACFGLSFGRS